jgi:hypothetical protein
LLCAVAAVACRSASAQVDDAPTTLTGIVTYRDAPVDAEGTTQQAVAPGQRFGDVDLTLVTSADADNDCPDASTGHVIASYTGGMTISDGQFTAPLYPRGLATPAGCPVAQPDVHAVASSQVFIEIPAEPATCAHFCGGTARADAIQQCRASGDPVACDDGLVSGYAARCEAACGTAVGIAGTGAIDLGKLGAYDGAELAAGKLGDLTARVVLDHLVDAQRQPIAIR